MRGHGHRLGIDHSDVGFVGNIDVHVTLAVSGGLLRCTAQIERPQDVAGLCIDHRDVGRGWLRT